MTRVLSVVFRLSKAGGIPTVVRSILRLSDPSSIHHYVCQVRPLTDDLGDGVMSSVMGVYSLDIEGNWTRSPRVLAASVQLLQLIREIRPHVVHLHTGSSLIALPSRLLLRGRCEWLFDLHEPLDVRHSRLTTWVVSAMVRRGAWCVTHTPPVAIQVEAKMQIPAERISVIPLGIDLERFGSPALARDEWRAMHGIAKEAVLVVTVGGVSELKGIWRLIEVADRIRNHPSNAEFVFAVIGNMRQPDLVKSEVSRRNLQHSVRLLGFVEDLPSALHAADVYFAPSSFEGFGLAVVEGMACGLPVIASAVGGLNHVVEDGITGFLREPDDIESFVQDILLLSQDPGRRAELGRRARQRAHDKFGEESMVSAYGELYRRLAHRESR